ncbi:MFS transporter [Pseudarthrobacter sp. N5]|uniref:MFS transporter n=1 Tax=Pseudarthrobacter sp. N5 TaxID=3418416 RepID=UPI003CF4E82D
MLSVLRNRSYARLLAAQLVALTGTGLLTVSLGLLAFGLAGRNAGAVLGTALTIKMLAYVCLSPVINALVARLPKKPVLIGSDLVRAAMALCLPLISDIWQIYVVIFLLQAASATFTPAFQSLIPSVLTKEKDYTHALSLSRLAYDAEALVSPALAGILLTALSYRQLFLGTAAGFLVSAALVATTSLPRHDPKAYPESLWHRTTFGVRIFWKDRHLRSLLVLNLVVAAPTALVLVNSVVYVQQITGRPETGLALTLACYGGGSMTVALLAPWLLARFGNARVIFSGATVIPLTLAGAAGIPAAAGAGQGWLPLLGLWLVLGAGTSAVLTPSSRLLRDASTAANRPYVFTAQFSLSHACYLVTYPLAGWMGATAGLGWTSAALAILATIGVAGAFLSWPRLTRAPIRPAPSEERSSEQP